MNELKENNREIQLGTLQTRAIFQPATFNEEKRTVEVVWTTGAKVLRQPFFGEVFYEELAVDQKSVDLSRLNSGAPLLNSHKNGDLNNVIGVVEKSWISNGEGIATVRFSDREEIKPLVEDVKKGILRNISVGYNVRKYKDVSGENEKIKTYRAIDWVPLEISIVAVRSRLSSTN